MRCPSCGYDSDIVDEYTCSNCGYIIQREAIERIPFFARREEKWYKADKPIKRIFNVITKPSKAFWDINNDKKDKGGLIIKLLLAFSLSLFGFALAIRFNPISYSYTGGVPPLGQFFQTFPLMVIFFIFGLIYYSIVFWFYNFAFSLGANFSVRLDDTLTVRYKIFKKENKFMDVLSGRSLRKELQTQRAAPTVKSLQEQDEMLTKIKQTGKFNVMTYAYAPLLVANLIGVLIALIALPTVTVSSTDQWQATLEAAEQIGASSVWGIIDAISLFTLAFWVPVTMSLALREIGNTNTTKLLIGNIIVGIMLAYVFYFLRPTLGWNLNILQAFQG